MWRFVSSTSGKPCTSTLPAAGSEEQSVQNEVEKITARKRVEKNNNYPPDVRYAIGKQYAAENSNIGAVRKFSKKYDHPVPESSVRNMKKQYLMSLKSDKEQTIKELPLKKRGKPLMLGQTLDRLVQKQVLQLLLNY